MNVGMTDMNVRGLSPAIWGKFAPPVGGTFQSTSSGNQAFGFFEDFLHKAATTLYDGWFSLLTGTGTYLRIATDWDPDAPTTTGIGLWQMLNTADNDESILAFGNALDALAGRGVDAVEEEDRGGVLGRGGRHGRLAPAPVAPSLPASNIYVRYIGRSIGSTWGAVDFAQTLVAQRFRDVGCGLRGRVSAADRLRAVPLRRELAGGAHSPASRAGSPYSARRIASPNARARSGGTAFPH